MSSFTTSTSGAQEASGRISSTLMFTMIGCLRFIGLIVGFLLVARKSCCAPRRSTGDASLPSYNDPHHHTHHTATRRGCPVASLCDLRCPHCLKRGYKGDDRSPRASFESLQSLSPSLPPPPFPPAAHTLPSSRPRGPTSWLPRTGPATSFNRTSVAAVGGTPATPSIPDSAPPPSSYYASRGPVGGPSPRYRQCIDATPGL